VLGRSRGLQLGASAPAGAAPLSLTPRVSQAPRPPYSEVQRTRADDAPAPENKPIYVIKVDGEREDSYVLNVLKAHVHNGRLVLDEPTDLPEGEVIYLQPVSEDDLDDEERAALHRELEASISEPGDLIDANDVLAELRAMK
jgi:hypothetical protein